MIDVLETFESLVNQNSDKPKIIYNFEILDNLYLDKKSFILDLSGQPDSLKTRLFYYWINNLINSGKEPLLISAKGSDQSLIKLEIDQPKKLIIAETNLIEDIYDILTNIPASSYVFIDGFYSINTLIDKYSAKPYLTMGKILKHLKQKYGHKIHVNSGISGMKNIPITYVFKDSIDYKCLIKKVKSKKGFVGLNYQMVGGYYDFCLDENHQIIYADINGKIQPYNTNLSGKKRVSHQ